jgi:hypothetical protein
MCAVVTHFFGHHAPPSAALQRHICDARTDDSASGRTTTRSQVVVVGVGRAAFAPARRPGHADERVPMRPERNPVPSSLTDYRNFLKSPPPTRRSRS